MSTTRLIGRIVMAHVTANLIFWAIARGLNAAAESMEHHATH